MAVTNTESDRLMAKQVGWQTHKKMTLQRRSELLHFSSTTPAILLQEKNDIYPSARDSVSLWLTISATEDPLSFTMTSSFEGNITFAQRSPHLPHLRKAFHGQDCDMWKWEVTDSPSLLTIVYVDNERRPQPTFCLSAVYSAWI